VADLWNAVQTSCEATFYGEADWERLRLELWYANAAMTCGRPLSGNTWPTIQHGLTELLISPAAKRRCAIEVRPTGPDPDADAALAMVGRYRQRLKPV
jgi:hypothetical protein